MSENRGESQPNKQQRQKREREGELEREREREMKIIFESPDLIWPNLLLKSPPDSSTLQFWESIHASSFCSQFALNSETHDANWHVYQRLPLSPSLPPFVCTFPDLTQALCCLRTLSWVYLSWVRWTSFALCCTNHILLLLLVNICIAFTIFQTLCDWEPFSLPLYPQNLWETVGYHLIID